MAPAPIVCALPAVCSGCNCWICCHLLSANQPLQFMWASFSSRSSSHLRNKTLKLSPNNFDLQTQLAQAVKEPFHIHSAQSWFSSRFHFLSGKYIFYNKLFEQLDIMCQLVRKTDFPLILLITYEAATKELNPHFMQLQQSAPSWKYFVIFCF